MYAEPDAEALAAKLEARADLYFFSRYMFKQRRGYRWLRNWHHQLICNALMRVYCGETKRLIINIPPRYSKTELAVVNFIAWSLGKAPDAEFIHTSYSGVLSVNNAANAKAVVETEAYTSVFPGVQLRRDSRAKGDWRTTAGGIVFAQGAGGTITGYGAGKLRDGFGGAIIIDDIHKADEARSDVIREGVIEWFKNTLESRCNSPHTPIIVIGQRLHERDLPGWLISGGNGEDWELLSIPAIAQPDNKFGIEPGVALWPDKHDIEALRRMEASKPYEFSGQYQQVPTPREGGMFERRWFEIVSAAPANMRIVRRWDLAASVPGHGHDPDWTVGVKIGRCDNGFFWILDVVRFRGSAHEVETAILNTAKQDTTKVTVGIPQDPGQAGKAQVGALTRMLVGFAVKSAPESGSKDTRAAPFASQCEAGNVKMMKASWNDAFLDEIEIFPFATHDDQVDAAAGAFNMLAESGDAQAWVSFMKSEAELRRLPPAQT